VDHTIARDNIFSEGLSVSTVISLIGIDVDIEEVLSLELVNSENAIGRTNGRFQAIHDVTRSKLLGTTSIDASSLRSLVVTSVLLSVDGAVGLSASKIAGQSSLWKNMQFQESELVDAVDQTSDLIEG